MSRIDAELLLQEGVAAAMRGKPGQAAQCWQRVLTLVSDADLSTQAYFNLGLLCRQSRNYTAALACFQHALDADTGNHEAREQLAFLLADSGELGAAIAHLEVLAETLSDARYYFTLGDLYASQDKPDLSEARYRTGLTLLPESAAALGKLGRMLQERGMTSAALACFKRAAADTTLPLAGNADPTYLQNAADALEVAGFWLERTVALEPDQPALLYDLAMLHIEQRCLATAEAGLRRVLELAPDHHEASVALAQLLLAQGRYFEGWHLHEARLAPGMHAGRRLLEPLATPVWHGESLQGRVLLLRQEQGFGDAIQFMRYLPRVQAFGPQRIIVHCHPALIPLLSTLPDIELSSWELTPPVHDVWISMMSVPRYCDGTVIPVGVPYLQAPANALAEWQARLGPTSGKLRVGLLWQGHRLHSNDVHRSLPSIESLAPLWALAGVEFFSLQHEPVNTALPLRQFDGEINDFADAAALIMQMDLVISVDSAYAHLAGALEKSVWVLISASRTDWRWGFSGTDSVWYPESMQLFRQARRGDWAPPVTAVRAALLALLHGHGGFAGSQ